MSDNEMLSARTITKALDWLMSHGGSFSNTPATVDIDGDISVDFWSVARRRVIAAGCEFPAVLTWLYRSFEAMRQVGLPDYSEPDFHWDCPNCGGELKKALVFMTIEERCECGFWRPAERVAA